jgi:hypothetical protein
MWVVTPLSSDSDHPTVVLVIMAEPLPINPYHPDSDLYIAYNACQMHEHDKGVELHARVLGYMILHVPTPGGRMEMAKDIKNCRGKDAFQSLAQLNIDLFIRPCESLIAYRKS